MHLYALSDADFSITKKVSDDLNYLNMDDKSMEDSSSATISAGEDPTAFTRAGEDPTAFTSAGEDPTAFIRAGKDSTAFMRAGDDPTAFTSAGEDSFFTFLKVRFGSPP